MGRIGDFYMKLFNRGVAKHQDALVTAMINGKLPATTAALKSVVEESRMLAQMPGNFFSAHRATAAVLLLERFKDGMDEKALEQLRPKTNKR